MGARLKFCWLRRQISLDHITTAPPPNLTRLLHNTASYAGYDVITTTSLFQYYKFIQYYYYCYSPFIFLVPPPPPPRAISPDARPLGTFENQNSRDGKGPVII